MFCLEDQAGARTTRPRPGERMETLPSPPTSPAAHDARVEGHLRHPPFNHPTPCCRRSYLQLALSPATQKVTDPLPQTPELKDSHFMPLLSQYCTFLPIGAVSQILRASLVLVA